MAKAARPNTTMGAFSAIRICTPTPSFSISPRGRTGRGASEVDATGAGPSPTGGPDRWPQVAPTSGARRLASATRGRLVVKTRAVPAGLGRAPAGPTEIGPGARVWWEGTMAEQRGSADPTQVVGRRIV